MPLIKVVFPDTAKRHVLINKKEQGFINEEFELEPKKYRVSIKSPPFDFTPTEQRITLTEPDNDEDPDKVTEVIFDKV
jgi:hypothetical protein